VPFNTMVLLLIGFIGLISLFAQLKMFQIADDVRKEDSRSAREPRLAAARIDRCGPHESDLPQNTALPLETAPALRTSAVR